MQVLTLTSLIALGMRFVSFVKYVRAGDWNSVVTQAASWATGVALVFLAGAADITNRLVLFPGVPALSDINAASKVLLGFMLLSLGSQVYEFKKALDRSDSATEPALMPPAKVVTVEGESVESNVPTKARSRKVRTEGGHLDWQTALLATAVAVLVYLVMSQVFEI